MGDGAVCAHSIVSTTPGEYGECTLNPFFSPQTAVSGTRPPEVLIPTMGTMGGGPGGVDAACLCLFAPPERVSDI